jgi:uncharacterized membrane protein
MILCTKCNEVKKGTKGEDQALWAVVGAVALFMVFGLIPSILAILGMGLYFYRTNNSEKFVCGECAIKICPKCEKKLTARNHCKEDKIAICQACGSHRQFGTPVTWKQVLVGSLLLPFILLLLLAAWLADPFLLVLLYFIYIYFSAPKCNQCRERINIAPV